MVKPYFEDSLATLYHGDCLEIMPLLPEESVDLLLVDPVYGIGYRTNWRKTKCKLTRNLANDSSLDTTRKAWNLSQITLKTNRHWYAFASPKNLGECCVIYLGYKQILAWDKGNQGTVGDLTCGFGEAWEAIFYGMKGRRNLRGKRPRTVIRHDWSSCCDPVHPTVKPIPLLEKLICMSTDDGETVLDFMAGSGTTLAAAKKAGRKSIGIELEESYCEIAADRLRQNYLF